MPMRAPRTCMASVRRSDTDGIGSGRWVFSPSVEARPGASIVLLRVSTKEGSEMGKKLVVAAVASVLAAAGGIGLASASSGLSGPKEIHLTSITDQSNFLDLGSSGPSQGDAFIFHDVLKREENTIGHDGGVCTITDAVAGEAQCVVTLSLDGGQITAQGLFFPPQSGSAFVATFPITGGSGIYRNVGGQVRVNQIT